jgi:hypothetical protein
VIDDRSSITVKDMIKAEELEEQFEDMESYGC